MSESNQGQFLNKFSVQDVELVDRKAVPDAVFACPSMMSADERTLLYSLARNHFSGEGMIVDAGLFLGASTVCFGQGIRDGSGAAGPSIDGFDRAIVTPHMIKFFNRHKIHLDLRVNDSLVETIRSETKNYADLVTFHFGDILGIEWVSDRPIEICFLDILKTYDINRHCLNMFLGSLLPGRSILIQQDYFYYNLPYLKVYQEYLADYFEYLGECHTSAVFRCRTPIPPDVFDEDLYRALSAEKLIHLHDQASLRTTDPARRLLCALSGIRLRKTLFGEKSGRRALQDVKERYADVLAESPQVRKIFRKVSRNIFKEDRHSNEGIPIR